MKTPEFNRSQAHRRAAIFVLWVGAEMALFAVGFLRWATTGAWLSMRNYQRFQTQRFPTRGHGSESLYRRCSLTSPALPRYGQAVLRLAKFQNYEKSVFACNDS